MLRCLRRDGGGGAITHALACVTARRRRHAQGAAMLVAALLTIFAFADAAFAEVDWHEQGSTMSATVAPYSYPDGRPYALAEFLGYDWGSLSSSVRTAITSASNGDNPFTSALTHTKNVQYETNGTLNWPIISIWSTIFGLGDMWDIEMSNTLYTQAREHMMRFIYPSDGTGGGTGGISGTSTVFAGNWRYYFSAHTNKYGTYPNTYTSYVKSVTQDGTVQLFTSPTTVEVNNNFFSNLTALYPQYEYGVVLDGLRVSNNNKYLKIAIYAGEHLTYTDETLSGFGTYNNVDYSYLNGNSYVKTVSGVVGYVSAEIPPTEYTVSGNSIVVNTTLQPNVNSGFPYSNNQFYGKQTGGTSAPPYQPEPDPPAQQPTLNAPTAPTLPTTNAPTTPDSTPNSYTTIVNNNYTQPTYNQQPTGTSQDYTPWLDEIIILLRSINDYIYMGFDDLSTWFGVVDADMRTGFDNVLARLSSLKTGVHSDLVWLADNLDDWITDAALYLATYLHECEEYLGDIVGEYSSQIASVVTWLKRIYSRLGGNGAGKPSPTTDEPGFFDWLIDLLTGFLSDLLNNLPEWLQRLIGGFQDLSEHFPFSIPWDVAAMLQLLYHEPVTPVFDLPMPTMSINGVRSVNLHIDLSSWNGVAAIIREMMFVIFAVSLALNTKKLLSNLDM